MASCSRLAVPVPPASSTSLTRIENASGGRIGCCDDSPSRHATAHFEETGHPVIRSIEPGEEWFWCYVDEVAFRVAAG